MYIILFNFMDENGPSITLPQMKNGAVIYIIYLYSTRYIPFPASDLSDTVISSSGDSHDRLNRELRIQSQSVERRGVILINFKMVKKIE